MDNPAVARNASCIDYGEVLSHPCKVPVLPAIDKFESVTAMRIYHPPFVIAEALVLLYPEIGAILHTITSRLENEVRVYNAFEAMDVVDKIRKQEADQASEAAGIVPDHA